MDRKSPKTDSKAASVYLSKYPRWRGSLVPLWFIASGWFVSRFAIGGQFSHVSLPDNGIRPASRISLPSDSEYKCRYTPNRSSSPSGRKEGRRRSARKRFTYDSCSYLGQPVEKDREARNREWIINEPTILKIVRKERREREREKERRKETSVDVLSTMMKRTEFNGIKMMRSF